MNAAHRSRDSTRVDLAAPRVINPWFVALAVVIPTFMEVLDTTIANVALRHIAGGLSAPVTDGEWVITSYLAANAIILPISGWLSVRLGRRNYFLLSIAVFTFASALMRNGHESEHAYRFACPSRFGRRRIATVQSRRVAGCVPEGKAGHGHDCVRRRGIARAGGRADARRLHHRQLRLALDLLSQCAGRATRAYHVPRGCDGPGLSKS